MKFLTVLLILLSTPCFADFDQFCYDNCMAENDPRVMSVADSQKFCKDHCTSSDWKHVGSGDRYREANSDKITLTKEEQTLVFEIALKMMQRPSDKFDEVDLQYGAMASTDHAFKQAIEYILRKRELEK